MALAGTPRIVQGLPSYRPNDLFETSFRPNPTLPGFFPGAGGFFHGHASGSKRFMFFGTDFGPLSYQQGLERTGGEPKTNETIRFLRAIVERANIPLDACFLTNAVLCMRLGDSATDTFSIWERYPDYVAACAQWHRAFIAETRPKLVALMGLPHLKVFGPILFPELSSHWAGLRTLADVFNASKETLRLNVGTQVLLMHHPSHWPAYPSAFKARIVDHLSAAASE